MSHPHVRPLRERGPLALRGDVIDDTFGRGAPSLTDPPRVDGVGEPARSDRVDALDGPGLRGLVRTLPVIEQAKGVLIGYYGITADQAFTVLRRWSSIRHVKVRDLCTTLVAGVAGFPRPDLTDGLVAVLDRGARRLHDQDRAAGRDRPSGGGPPSRDRPAQPGPGGRP